MEEKIKYSSLTEFQKKCIVNGCGGKGGKINPPEFFFNASCNQHDFYYWRGGNEEDRLLADNMFYDIMKQDSLRGETFLHRKFHLLVSFIYYFSVRKFGKEYFNYGNYKTMDDVLELTNKVKKELRDLKKGDK